MSLINNNKLILGAAQNFNDICWVYPLKIKEIIGMGEENYNRYLAMLTISLRDIQSDLTKAGASPEELNFTTLEYLFLQAYGNDTFLLELEKAFSTFIREKVHFSFEERVIYIGSDFSMERSLNNDNFEDFQNILRTQNKLSVPEPIPANENPMARKFRLRREQVAEAKRKQALKHGETISLSDSICTLVCFNVGVTFQSVGDLTIYQFKELLTRAQMKYKYDLDMRMIAAGADPKKIKPKSWFGKIEL